MVVMGVSRSGPTTVTPRRRGVEARKFGVEAEGAAQAEGTMMTAGVAVTSLLALQEDESGLQQDRAARQHGSAVLEELAGLQRALVSGDEPDLTQLAHLAARPIVAADPGLAGVLRAVRLRAGIELARRGHALSM